MRTLHTAEFHRLLGTPVRLDLGETTGLLAGIDSQVTKLDLVTPNTDRLPAVEVATTVTLPESIGELSSHVTAKVDSVLGRLGTPRETLLADILSAIDRSAEELVARIVEATTPEPFEIGDEAAALVRLLVQAEGYALARSPGATNRTGDENKAMARLQKAAAAAAVVIGGDAGGLAERFVHAFDAFASDDLPSRSKRFAEMHALIEEIALYLQGQ